MPTQAQTHAANLEVGSDQVVLVVDDDPGMRDTIVDILEVAGLNAVGASSAAAAIEVAESRHVAVAVIDQRLPDESGTQLAGRLRATDVDLRAVMLTGYASLESVMAAMGHVEEYLVKPVPPDQLVRAVRSALERRGLVQERRDLLERLQDANRSLEEGVIERTRELASLRAASDAISESVSLEDVLAVAVSTARRVTGARAAGIYVVSQDEPSRLTLRRRDGETWRLPAGLDWAAVPIEERPLGEPERDALVINLPAGGQQVGALVLSQVETWSPDFLHTLAAKLGMALQNAQRFERERETVERLSELSRMKNDFLAAVSHELRTPLTVVIGFAETLLRRGAELTDERRTVLLERIVAQGGRLSRLVDDLIDATGLESGLLRVETGPVDVTAVVRRAVDSMPPSEHRVEVDVPAGFPPVVADATRLEQVLVNLLDNARKYSKPGCTIRVRGVEEGREVQLLVVDEGQGVPPEFLDRMFEPFAQADTGDTRTDHGVGLGLSIASGLVRGMGGTIDAASAPGQGTTISVRLMVSPVPAGLPQPAPAHESMQQTG